MKNKILEKIKSRGYWRINFEPLAYEEKFKSLTECKEAVTKNAVALRGWDYPHVPRRQDDDQGLAPGNNFYEGWTNWSNYIEFWRMYQSGQFLHYLALRDDWMELSGWGITGNRTDIKPGEVLNIIGEVTYEMTEIFEFLSRLAKNGVYDKGVRVSISLNNTKDRKLVIMDSARFPLMWEHKTGAEKIELAKEYTQEEIITKPKELAYDVIMSIFDRFGWENPSSDVIKKDQDDLLNRRF